MRETPRMSTLLAWMTWFGALVALDRNRSPESGWEVTTAIAIAAAMAFAGAWISRRVQAVQGAPPVAPDLQGRLAVVPLLLLGGLAMPELWPAVLPGLVLLVLWLGARFRGWGKGPAAQDAWTEGLRVAWIGLGIGASFAFYDTLEPYLQDVSTPAPLAVALARLMGFDAFVTEGKVWFSFAGESMRSGTAPRHAELFAAGSAWAALLLDAGLGGRTRKSLLAFAVAAAPLCLAYREFIVLGKFIAEYRSHGPLHLENALVLHGLIYLPLFLAAPLVAKVSDGWIRPSKETIPHDARPVEAR